jgi:hypothetical protein
MRILACTLVLLIPIVAAAADPAMPAPPARSHKDADLKWGPCPAFIPAGCEIAVLNGDPAKDNADVFFKVPGASRFPGTGTPRPSAWCWFRAR